MLDSFIHSEYFYSASSSPLLLRGAPDAAWILCWGFTPKRHRQLRVKDLPKVPMWQLERDSNPQPSGRQVSTLPMSHHAPQVGLDGMHWIAVQQRIELSLWFGCANLVLY